jgi:hypothetical protein
MSDVNTYMGKFGKRIVVGVAVSTMGLVMVRLLLRVATAQRSSDEVAAAPPECPDEVVAAPPEYPNEVVAAVLWSLGVTKRSCRRGRDEEKRTSWIWFHMCFKAENDEGHVLFFFPPKLDSKGFSESEWTVIISKRVNDRLGEPMNTTISLPEVLRHCGVEECRQAMVFAHQRATMDAKRREAASGATPRVSDSLAAQLEQAGKFAPRGTSRTDGYLGSQVGDLLGSSRDGQSDDPDDSDGLPFKPPEYHPLGRYASVAGGPQDRQIVVIGSGSCWTVSDALISPMPEDDDDIDLRCLPEPFDSREKAFVEGHRHLELARRKGGPSPNFEE